MKEDEEGEDDHQENEAEEKALAKKEDSSFKTEFHSSS